MGLRSRSLRKRVWLVTLTMVGLFLAGPVSSSGERERDLKPRPSCPSAVAGHGEDINDLGSPNAMNGGCVGAPFSCTDYM